MMVTLGRTGVVNDFWRHWVNVYSFLNNRLICLCLQANYLKITIIYFRNFLFKLKWHKFELLLWLLRSKIWQIFYEIKRH